MMARQREQPDPEGEGDDIPPAITCATCGLSTCEGCTAEEVKPLPWLAPSVLPWEQSAPTLRSLLETALLTAERPGRSFGQLGGSRLTQAFAFALVCELLAISSLITIGIIGSLWLMPKLARNLLSDPRVWLAVFSLTIFCTLGMVALHAVWGDYLERGVRRAGAQRDVRLGLRFGLYACGWDLITSPAGILFCLLFRRSGFLGPLIAASQVPRRAMRAYLGDCRDMTEEAQTRALQHATWLALATTLVGFLALASAFAGYLLRLLV